MSLLTLISDTCRAIGLPVPTAAYGSSDLKIQELISLSNDSGNDLALKFNFPEMLSENTFTTVAALDQGLLNSTVVSSGDYLRFVADSMWNRTINEKITGPISSSAWQQAISNGSAAPPFSFRIRNKRLYIGPTVPTAGQTVAFEYYSSKWCASVGGTRQAAWAADTDVGFIPENILKLDLIWRWKHAKGFEYAEDMETASQAIDTYTGSVGGARLLILGGASYGPTINLPDGSWNL